MESNVAVNITLPIEIIKYLDTEAKRTYLSRATVAKQLLLQKIDEVKVTNARRNGYSIRKISETYNINYTKVLEILRDTQIDAEDKEVDEYVEETMNQLSAKKIC